MTHELEKGKGREMDKNDMENRDMESNEMEFSDKEFSDKEFSDKEFSVLKNSEMESQFDSAVHIVMDEVYLQDHDVIQRFIRHDLRSDELAAFEIMLITDASLIERIEMQRLINASFKQQLPASNDKNAFVPQYWSPLLRKALPIAATLMMGLFIGLKTFDRAPVADTPVFTASTLVLESFRGAGQESTIELSTLVVGNAASSKVLLPLRIDVGPQLTAEQRYQLQLTAQGDNGNGAVLAKATALAASSEGWLEYSLQLPANLRGHYVLQISQLPVKDSGSDEQQNFPLNFH